MFRIISKSYILSNKLLLGRIDTEIYRRHLFSYFLYSLLWLIFSSFTTSLLINNQFMYIRDIVATHICVTEIKSHQIIVCWSNLCESLFVSPFSRYKTMETLIVYSCIKVRQTYGKSVSLTLTLIFFCCYTFVFANVMSCRANWCEERKWVAVRK